MSNSNLASFAEAQSALSGDPKFADEFCALAERHGLSKFVGLALIHHHPERGDGEVFIETARGDGTLMLKAMPTELAPADAVDSIWRIERGILKPVQKCGGCRT